MKVGSVTVFYLPAVSFHVVIDLFGLTLYTDKWPKPLYLSSIWYHPMFNCNMPEDKSVFPLFYLKSVHHLFLKTQIFSNSQPNMVNMTLKYICYILPYNFKSE